MKRKQGFTLIELLVVIAIIGMLAGILIPVVSDALNSAAMAKTLSNGKSIYQAAAVADMENMNSGAFAAFPYSGDYSTSTEYFKDLVTNDYMSVTFEFFAAQDIPAARSSDPADFAAENNAWKLVAGIKPKACKDGTPFLFTRNYNPGTIPTGKGDITEDQLADNDGCPFGSAGLIVVQKGGAAQKLSKQDLKQENFNSAGKPGTSVTLTILNP